MQKKCQQTPQKDERLFPEVNTYDLRPLHWRPQGVGGGGHEGHLWLAKRGTYCHLAPPLTWKEKDENEMLI